MKKNEPRKQKIMAKVIINKNRLKQKGLFVSQDFKKGEVILDLTGPVADTPTKHSIEVGENKHITDKFGYFLNHSCNPNCKIGKKSRQVIAKKSIQKGEELFFNYNSSESKMATPFKCSCGAKNCQGRIKGIK